MFDPEVIAGFRKLDPGAELTLSKRLRQPMAKVFAALSTPERIADWMGVVWQGDPAPLGLGSNFSYTFANSDMPSVGRVTAYDPPRLIEHTWFENQPPGAVVRWRLEPLDEGCRLTLVQSTARQDDGPRNGVGWTMIMRQLDAWLSGETPSASETWSEARARLIQTLGPEAVRDGVRSCLPDGRTVIQFKRVTAGSPDAVWAWLVEPARLKDWLGDCDVDLRVGGAYRIRFAMAPIVMEGTITEVDVRARHLALIWREPWFKNDDVILEFDLEPYGDGHGLLTLTHTFPAGYDPQEYLAGWHEFMDELENAMKGVPFVWDTPERKREYALRQKVYQAIAGAGG